MRKQLNPRIMKNKLFKNQSRRENSKTKLIKSQTYEQINYSPK